jgi:regulator of cell morphogenesis and NO signaling
VRETFAELAAELDAHMLKEENILFPYIAELARGTVRTDRGCPAGPSARSAIPSTSWRTTTRSLANWRRGLRTLSDGFATPADADRTYRLCYQTLDEFVQDLHRHIHLEHTVLFPGAIALEDGLS